MRIMQPADLASILLLSFEQEQSCVLSPESG